MAECQVIDQKPVTQKTIDDKMVEAAAKQAYPEPLLTSLDSDLAHAQQASSQDAMPGFSSPEGYYVSYMHPPGSLLGAGVTVGMQF
jgi:hypothetical protein